MPKGMTKTLASFPWTLSVSEISDILTIIGLSCDCGLDKKGLIGQSISLRWDGSLQTEVLKYLGFDADYPIACDRKSTFSLF